MATNPQRSVAANIPIAAAPARLGLHGRLELDETLMALVQDGLLSADDARRVRADSRSTKEKLALHPLVLVANAKAADQRNPDKPLALEILTQWLAGKAGLPYLRIDPMKIDVAAVTQVISHQYATRYRILPVAVAADKVTIASAEPFDVRWVSDLSHILRREVERVVSSPIDVNRYLTEFFGVQRSIQRAKDAKGDSGYDPSKLLNFEQLLELGKSGDIGADDRHVVHIVDWLLQYALDQRASDIHLEPRRDAGNIRFRIDGNMIKVFEFPPPVMTAVTARIKILGRMDLAEKRRPQDGRIKTRSPGGREVELRLSTMPTAFGEKIVMRIFDPDIVVKEFRQIGFSTDEENLWRSMVERPHGIVLVTGPTGSGKTTTLYAALSRLDADSSNIMTVEDPIEYELPGVGQTQVNAKIDLTFAKALRAILRQDPDVIMIGEIRDFETAQIAIQASLTGHLVLATLHTNDAASAVTRLTDMGVEPFLLSSSLLGVLAQRLVRKVCHACGGKGCEACGHQGYAGRTGLFELLVVDDALRALVHNRASEAEIRAAALAGGMQLMREDGERLIAAGVTTREEVLRVTRD